MKDVADDPELAERLRDPELSLKSRTAHHAHHRGLRLELPAKYHSAFYRGRNHGKSLAVAVNARVFDIAASLS